MSTPGTLKLVGQDLQVVLGDGQFARIGSVVVTATPPGPLIDSAGNIVNWTITAINVSESTVTVSGGPVTNTLYAPVQNVISLNLVSF